MSMSLTQCYFYYSVSLQSIEPIGLFNQHDTHSFNPWSVNSIHLALLCTIVISTMSSSINSDNNISANDFDIQITKGLFTPRRPQCSMFCDLYLLKFQCIRTLTRISGFSLLAHCSQLLFSLILITCFVSSFATTTMALYSHHQSSWVRSQYNNNP